MEATSDAAVLSTEVPAAQPDSAVADRLARLESSVNNLTAALKDVKNDVEEDNPPLKEHKNASRLVLAATFGLIGHGIGSHIGLRTGFIFNGRKLLGTANPFKFGRRALNQPEKALPLLIGTSSSTLIGGVIGAFAGAITGFWRGNRISRPSDLISQPIESLQHILGVESKDNEHVGQDTPSVATQKPTAQWSERVKQEAPSQAAMRF